MQSLQLLKQGGYAISLSIQDGMPTVVVRRTPQTTISQALAAPLLLAVMRDQDAALQHMAGVLYRRCMTQPDDEITIAEYNVCIGQTMTSDGLRWVDVLTTYRAERDAVMMRRAA